MPITGQTYFLPTQITGCSLWLDAADSSTVILSGVNVTQWNDKSGNAANATASGNGILYTQSAINSKPAILLPGNSTYTFFTGTSISGTLNQAIFIVTTTISGITQYSRLLSFGGAGDYNSLGNMVVGWNSPGGVLIERNGIFLPSTNALVYSTPFITSSVISGTSVLGYINGTNTLTGTTTSTNFTHSQYEIGSYTASGGYTWYGYVGEVIIYNSSISDTQRQQIEGYLAQKWGLTGSLISGHPGLDKIIHRNIKTTFTKKQYFTAFSPRQIAGCTHWFDATDSSTITLSSGSLTQWNDKSGNGRNLTAVSGFANATVSSAYQNGLNVFNFSGNGLYRTAAGNVSYPLDVYIIVALKSLTTHVDVLGMGDTSVDNFNSLTFAESAASRWHNGSSGGARQTISTSNETSLSFLLIQWSIANGNYLLRRNGTQLIQASRTYSFNNSATSIFQIGYRHTDNNGVNFSGYIGEIVVFNNQIGTTDRQNVESYLAQKWGLVSSLAAGHLNETFPAGSPTAIQPFLSRIRPALTNTIRLAIFSYTGSIQTYTVPAGKTSATIYIWGAAGGGDPYGNSGGAGAFITGIMPVTAGTTYYIVVGGGGRGLFDYPALYVNPGGYGGGATGYYAAGGGGYSGIFSGLTPAQGNTLLLAGGGGGAGPGGYGGSAAWSGTAQAGGGGGVAGSAGQGGTTSAGGAAGTPQTQGIADTTYPGTALAGGNGAQNYGGAGGGGYWGGGGGTYNNGANGGGGGSSYSNPTYLFSVSGAQSTTGSGSTVAPGNTNPYYVSGVGAAGVSGASGGNGLIVIN